jgi:[ribosomal protein S5]-alanine N-acetyltransferase
MISSKKNFLFAIIEKSTKKHIGNIKIGPVNQFHKFADISYFIGDRDAWGRGYGTQAVKLLTEYSFNYLGLESILAGVYQSNIASQRVLEKAGYSLQGRICNQLFNSNGDREDHLYYSINK